MSDPATNDVGLAARVAAGLAASLRAHGLLAPLGSVLIFAESLCAVGLGREQSVYWAARAVFVHEPDEVQPFNLGFYAYWRSHAQSGLVAQSQVLVLAPSPSDAAPESGATDEELDPSVAGTSFSAAERLAHADLAELSDDELALVMEMLEKVRRSRVVKLTRRVAPGRQGRLDLRRSVAAAVRRDGEILGEHHLSRRVRERRIVVLCDISGSMAPYARAMLRLAHVLAQGSSPVEVFAVGTRLTRLTRKFATHDANAAMRGVSESIPDYSGGTRLGDGLGEFNTAFGVRGVARGAIVVICSDGIDRGSPELIRSEMGRLSRVAYRVLWVNPLAASPGYQPLARGMAAALPYIDRFLPGDSPQALLQVLEAVSEGVRTPTARHQFIQSVA